jgi:hypothetical protein
MLQNGSHHHDDGTNHHLDQDKEAWRQLLRNAMCILNMQAHIADCNKGSCTPGQPQLVYYGFNPYNPASVSAQAQAVCKCLDDIRKTARMARAALPPIEALPRAIRQCTLRIVVDYLDSVKTGQQDALDMRLDPRHAP